MLSERSKSIKSKKGKNIPEKSVSPAKDLLERKLNKKKSEITVINDEHEYQDYEKIAAAIIIQRWYRHLKCSNIMPRDAIFDELLDKTARPSNTILKNTTPEDLAEDRVKRIMSYLKTVEEDSLSSVAESVRESRPSRLVVPGPNLLLRESAMFDSVKSKISGLQVEIQEKGKMIQALKDQIDQIKLEHREQLKAIEQEKRTKLQIQKKSYEAVVKRHLSFIDKLLKEKEDISLKCEKINLELTEMENKYKNRLKDTEVHYIKDLKFQKEQWSALEKVKRDKWIQEKSQSIRDQTIKGLEPEIQKMLGKHQLEIKQLEEKLHKGFSQEKLLLMEEHSRDILQMKQKWNQEKDQLIDEERELMKKKMQQQMEKQELEFQQYKRNQQSDFEEQKQYLRNSHLEEKRLLDVHFQEKLDRLHRQQEEQKRAHNQQIADLQTRHTQELSQKESFWRQQFDSWKATFQEQVQKETEKREAELKNQLRKERDIEIDKIVIQLAEEQAMQAAESDSQVKLKNLQSRYDTDVRELKREIQYQINTIYDLKSSLNRSETEKSQLKEKLNETFNEMSKKEKLLYDQNTELSSLRVKEDSLRENIKQEYVREQNHLKIQIRDLSRENEKLKDDIHRLKANHDRERHNMEQDKNDTLLMVESKVKKTIAMKDDMIQDLREQLSDMSIKCIQLEKLMDKQRQELLGA